MYCTHLNGVLKNARALVPGSFIVGKKDCWGFLVQHLRKLFLTFFLSRSQKSQLTVIRVRSTETAYF